MSNMGEGLWTYPALVDTVTLTDSGFADHLLSNSSGDRYPRAECRPYARRTTATGARGVRQQGRRAWVPQTG